MKRWLLSVPVVLFLALVFLLWHGFRLADPHQLPSELIGQPFPAFNIPRLDGTRATEKDLTGQVALVNVWATWCPTCLSEHALLLKINKAYNLPIYGVNYKDDAKKAKQWLTKLGNPYVFNLLDSAGQLGINLGVYGAPETFVIDAMGIIRYRRVGDVNERIWVNELLPALQAIDANIKAVP